MPIDQRVVEQARRWRHELHAIPETAFEEHATAALLAGDDTLDGTVRVIFQPAEEPSRAGEARRCTATTTSSTTTSSGTASPTCTAWPAPAWPR